MQPWLITDPQEFYDEIVVPSGFFEKAREIFPDYNNRQSDAAACWIVYMVEESIDVDADLKWSNLVSMRDDIFEMIIAGLT
jgi:hypothetical protein